MFVRTSILPRRHSRQTILGTNAHQKPEYFPNRGTAIDWQYGMLPIALHEIRFMLDWS